MVKKILISSVVIASLSGCKTTQTPPREKPIQSKTVKPETKPELANFPFAKWEGRNIYDFFYDVYEKGAPVSSLENEVFSTMPHKGVSWKITQSSGGMIIVGVNIPSELEWDERDKWESKIPFPVHEANFVIDRWSEESYIKGQKFKKHVMFTGYEEGFTYTFFGETHEIKKLCFLTANGLDDAKSYFESQEE